MKRAIILLISILGLSTLIKAQEKRNLRVSDLFNSYNVIDATFSPNNLFVAVVVERPTKDQVTYGVSFIYRYDIWLGDLEKNTFELVMDGKKDSCSYWNPVWSPDSKNIAVLSTKSEDNVRAYIFNLSQKVFTKVHSNGANLMNKTYAGARGFDDPYVWIDKDNILLAVLDVDQADATFSKDYLSHQVTGKSWRDARYNINATKSTLDTDSLHIFPHDERSYLINYNLEKLKSEIIDTGYFRHVIPSPDKRKLLVVKRKGATPIGQLDLITNAWSFKHQVGIINLKSKKRSYLSVEDFDATATYGDAPYIWTQNNLYVIIENSNNNVIGHLNSESLALTIFGQPYESLIKTSNEIYTTRKSNKFLINSTNGNIKEYNKAIPKIEDFNTPIEGNFLSKSNDNKYAISVKSDGLGLHLFLANRSESKLLHSFNTWASQIQDVKREIINFKDGYGQMQKALLLHPSVVKGKSPVVVSCYPGQTIRSLQHSGTTINSDLYLNVLLLTSKGYFVLIPTIKTQGQDDYFEFGKSVLPAIDAIPDIPEIDRDNIGLLGVSYGGYSVYSLITQSTRFKSAIVLAGFANLSSYYGNFDMRYRYSENPFENVQRLRNPESGQGGLGVPPFKNPLKYIRNSPSFYADKIQTPIMIIHGDRDMVSIEQAEGMFTSLYRQGKKARFVRFWGEGHNINSTKNIESMWNEIFNWLELTLKK